MLKERIFTKESFGLEKNNLAEDFFNQLTEAEFIEAVCSLVRGMDYLNEHFSVEFSHNLEKWTIPFDGIRLSNQQEDQEKKVTICSEAKLRDLLINACESFTQEHPNRQQEVQGLLGQIYPIL